MDTSFLERKRNFVATVAVIGLVAGVLTAVMLGGGVTEIASALGVGLVLAAVVVGTYAVGRRAGHPQSHAVAEAAVGFGVVVLLGITLRLLTEFGERTTGEVLTGVGALIVGFLVFLAAVIALGRYGPSPS